MKRLTCMTLAWLLMAGCWAPAVLATTTFGFFDITHSSAINETIGEAQLLVDVSDPEGAHNVLFTFKNIGPSASSICDVYFDDGTLLSLASVTNGPGVRFTQAEISKVSPPDLPGGNNITPPFHVTGLFKADSDAPVQPNGVNPGEQLGILFTLQSTEEFGDTLAALADGSLRIGIHVQGFANGGNESFVNNPSFVPSSSGAPVPPTALLLGTGLVGLGLLGWRRRKTS